MAKDCDRGHKGRRNLSPALTRGWMRAALGAAFAVAVFCGHSSAARAGDDDSFYSTFMRTLGLKNPMVMKYGIDYNERSPLVVPPTRDLPPPQAAGAPAIPDWPKDPDLRKRAAAEASEKVEPHEDWVVETSRPLRPDELNVRGRPSGGGSGQTASHDPAQEGAPDLSPPKKGLFSFDMFKKQEYTPFTGEPARASLTDPPPGYLTPSPDQPYGLAPDHTPPKAQSLATRGDLQR